MQTYDVYLRNRITEINVFITNLLSRDLLYIYNKLYLSCSRLGIELTKQFQANSNLILNILIDSMTKNICETINNELKIDVDVDLSSQFSTDIDFNTICEFICPKIIHGYCYGYESNMEFKVDPLDFYIGHSLGSATLAMKLEAEIKNSLKTCFENFNNSLQVLLNVDPSSSKIIELYSLSNFFDIGTVDIFYQRIVSGEADMILECSPIEKYVLNKVIHDLESELIFSVICSDDLHLTKFESLENATFLTANKLEMMMMMKSDIPVLMDMGLSCNITLNTKRYRTLEDMDNVTLADLDNSKLEELDYIIVED